MGRLTDLFFGRNRNEIEAGGIQTADLHRLPGYSADAVAAVRNGRDGRPEAARFRNAVRNIEHGRYRILNAAGDMYKKAGYFIAATAVLGVLTLAGLLSTGSLLGYQLGSKPAKAAPIVRTLPQSKYAPGAKKICDERAYFIQEIKNEKDEPSYQLVVRRTLPHLDETVFEVNKDALQGNDGLVAKLKEAENKDADAGLLGLQGCYTPKQCLQILEKAAGYDNTITKDDCKNIKGVGK